MKAQTQRRDTDDAPTPARITIDLPGQPSEPAGYAVCHVDLTLDTRQAKAVRQLQDLLGEAGTKLANGRPIRSTPDAVRYLLDAVATAFDGFSHT